MDSVVLLSILFVFLSAFVSNIVRNRNKDRVLKELQGFQTTIKMQDGNRARGLLSIYTNGMELKFTGTHPDQGLNKGYSYILYGDDLDQVQTIYRYHSELSLKNQAKRQKDVDKTANPSLFRRFYRFFRNFMNNFRDAFNESMSLFLSRMKGMQGVTALSSQDKYLQRMGTSALSMVGNAYDSILEHHINKRVIIAVDNKDKRQHFSGFLKEYSPSWISVLDCHVKGKHCFTLSDIEHIEMQRDIDIAVYMSEGEQEKILIDVEVFYYGYKPMKLIGFEADGYQHSIDTVLNKGESISLCLNDVPECLLGDVDLKLLPLQFEMISPERRKGKEPPAENEVYQSFLPEIGLVFEAERVVDVYIPRSRGKVRHSGEF